ncbi:MAG: prolyl oligopeptidase family serine peptidase [Planctomycetota bacterium]|nr:prolyl oligopeptidase family serine peptidase [Planctomycetota bacterium]
MTLSCAAALAAQAPSGWLDPGSTITSIVTAPAQPAASLSPQGGMLVMRTREALPGLEVIARPHLKLAGMRIDGATWGRQLSTRTTALTIQKLPSGDVHRVPIEADHWGAPIWSADDRAFALLRERDGGAELYVCDPWDAAPKLVEGVRVNQVLGTPVQWMPDQRRLLVRAVVAGATPQRPRVPAGPIIQQTVRSQNAQVRTYQDLLQDSHDEDLLEFYGRSQLVVVDGGEVAKVGAPRMYARATPSPDGTLLLVEAIERPFSFVVPVYRFPRRVEVVDMSGEVQRTITEQRLNDAIPIGGVQRGPRSVRWVPTAQRALCWFEAQDEGDPKVAAPHRDFAFLLTAPDATPRLWYKTEFRAGAVQFGGDGQLVLTSESDRKSRTERVWRRDLTRPGESGELLYERSRQDAYSDPGRPMVERTRDGRSVLRQRGQQLLLSGVGASPEGNRPFLVRWDVASGEKRELFRSGLERYETVLGMINGSDRELLIRSESPSAPPELLYLDRDTGRRQLLHRAVDLAADYTAKIEKRLVRYEREDGVPMNGTLYLPPSYKDGDKLPCLLWAYPREYTKASDAGQVRATPNRYLRMRGSSHLFMLLRGYAVFDNASMPIVGPRRSANDTFVEQVRMNARAAIKALAGEGCVDTEKVAVAGHSYGAFMTANLLAHSDLFCCGIARSGAYNRSLTPFGFQNEERTFWEAPEIYFAMSPFMHAQKINEPILLIHGQDDNNSGTFPIQSKRLYGALKGHGATARLCFLPFESHGYRGRQSVLHCLAEMASWLDQHCKGAGR